jgi:hypothetical protein
MHRAIVLFCVIPIVILHRHINVMFMHNDFANWPNNSGHRLNAGIGTPEK